MKDTETSRQPLTGQGPVAGVWYERASDGMWIRAKFQPPRVPAPRRGLMHRVLTKLRSFWRITNG